MVLLEIAQANLQVQFTGTGNDVLTRLVDHGEDARVRLGQTLETFDEFGQIVGVLDLDGALHDGGDGELHDLQVVRSLRSREGTRLEQELVDTNETKNVTGGHILNGLSVATHHENGTLDALDEQVLLAARGVVWTLNADLETRAGGTGEDTTEGVETALVGGRHHLGDVQHERALVVAVANGDGGLVVVGALVESLHAVLLGGDGRRQVENHHLQKSVGGGQELAHDNLEELLALEVPLVTDKLDLELLEKLGDLLLLEVHDGIEDTEDGVQTELVESTLELGALVSANLGPLLGLRVKVVVALEKLLDWCDRQRFSWNMEAYPEPLHHLGLVNTKLLGVSGSELPDGEGPAVKTGTESNGTLVGVDLNITKRLVEVGRDDDVDGLDDTGEILEQVLLGQLQFEQRTVDLVDDNDRLDALTESLTEHSLSLHAHAFNGVNDDESAVGDTQGGSDLGGKVNVTGRVDQVDQELVLLIRGLAGTDDVLHVIFIAKLGEEGDGSRLDGDTTLLLVGASIGETSRTSVLGRNDTSALDERVGEGGLSVVDMGNDGHVTDVLGSIHETTDLLGSEAVRRILSAWGSSPP